jgi:glycosyltransferase involved in cell wall biosynthesis
MFEPSKIKVCFLAGTLGRGGAERQLIYMLRALKSVGVSTRVMSLTRGEALESEIRSLGVDIEHICESPTSRRRKLMRIVKSLRQAPVDILQGVHFYTNLYAATAARLTRSKDIGAIRSNLSFDLQASGMWGRLQLATPRHLITNSFPSQELAMAKGISPERIHFVPNVVEVNGDNGRHSNSNGSVRILFVGRLTEEKRADRFLRVVSKVINQAPRLKVQATVAGDGPLRPRLLELAETLGLNGENLQILGEQEDMNSLYRQSDFLMLTSDMEGTPNVLLEAMAHGLPVAATRVGGVPSIVGADRGLLVDPGDEEGLAEAALRLAVDSDLRRSMGRYGHGYVSRFHSLASLPNRLLSIYREVLA